MFFNEQKSGYATSTRLALNYRRAVHGCVDGRLFLWFRRGFRLWLFRFLVWHNALSLRRENEAHTVGSHLIAKGPATCQSLCGGHRTNMHNTTLSRIPFFSLIANLRDEVKALIREEIKLAKTEMSEKFGMFGKNAAFLAVGGLIAYGGALILFTGLGGLIAYFFSRGGMNPLMAIALGLLIMGLLVAGLGAAFAMKALSAFKQESLAPEKTIDAIKHNTDKNPAKERKDDLEAIELKRSPDEIKSEIDTTQDLMKAHARELKHRLTPGYMGKAFAAGVRHHPVRASLIGAASGLVGFFVVKHRRNGNGHHHNNHH